MDKSGAVRMVRNLQCLLGMELILPCSYCQSNKMVGLSIAMGSAVQKRFVVRETVVGTKAKSQKITLDRQASRPALSIVRMMCAVSRPWERFV